MFDSVFSSACMSVVVCSHNMYCVLCIKHKVCVFVQSESVSVYHVMFQYHVINTNFLHMVHIYERASNSQCTPVVR